MESSAAPEVSLTAVWFLVAIVVVTAGLIVFYLYFTKKVCFKSCHGFDKILEPDEDSAKKSIAKSFDDSDSDSSSDSDEETFRNFQKAIRRSNNSIRNSANAVAGPSQSADHPQPQKKMSIHQSEVVAQISSVDDRSRLDLDKLPQDSEGMQDLQPSSFGMSRTTSTDDWTVEEESMRSKDVNAYSTVEEEDEVAAAIRAKPMEKQEDESAAEEVLPISFCGTLDIALQYFLSEKKLQISVLHAKDLPSKDRGGASIIQVHAVVLPAKKKRYKTKVQHITSPYFGETFKISQVSPEDLRGIGLRFRLYGIGKVRDRLIGEATVRLDELNLIKDPQLTVTLQLEPRTDVNRGELGAGPLHEHDVSAASTLTHGGNLPELLLSLSYNEMTGRLMVEIGKGSHFKNLTMTKPPDTFVKLVLLNSACQEMAQSKTTLRRSQPNPVFKETFYFQVALFQLAEVSLMISVYCRSTIKRKSILGWITMGRNNSSDMDQQHWQEMREAGGKPVSRWHTLIES